MSTIPPRHVPPISIYYCYYYYHFYFIIVVVVVVVVQNVYTLFPFAQCGEYGLLAASCRNSSGSSTVTGSSANIIGVPLPD